MNTRKTIFHALAMGVQLIALLQISTSLQAAESDVQQPGEQWKPIVPQDKIARAVEVLDAQMSAPAERRVAAELLANAQCLALIPDMVQGGLGVGFKHGNGVISCRHEDRSTWGAPIFIRLSGASVGAQLGVQIMDVMVIAMTDNGLNQLLAAKPIATGEAGVSIGPVGRNAEIAMDVLLQTPLLSYTRSKGFYAGATLGGSVFTTAKNINTDIYGEYDNVRDLLLTSTEIPVVMQPLVDVLNKYSPTVAQE